MRTIHALFGAPHGAKRADPPALAPRNENENEGENATPALERPEKRRRGSAPGASSLGECPLCGRSFHLALLQAHAAGCAGKAPPPDRPPPRPDAEAAAAARADGVAPPPTRPSPSPATLEPARASAPVSPGRAAAGVATFAALMKAQRGATVKRAFSLWRDARTGAFRWALERGSEPGAETSAALASAGGIAWRARVRLKETSADGRPCETTLFLATSVAPASAAESAAIRDAARGVHSHSEGSSGSVGGNTARRPDRETPRLAPSLVKSALQKCVRRGRVGGAHRTAALLLAEAPADALRRLLVIAVEDAAAHPDSPLVAWLMCADSKGFKLPRAVVDAVAGFAAELAACAIKDRADPPPKTPTTPPEGRSSESAAGALAARNVHAQCAGLGARASAIVAALAIRARFGGMAGDVEMLRSFAATWRSRFLGEDEPNWLARLDLAYAEARRKAREALGAEGVSSATGPGVVSRRDVPPAAVDFHVSPVVEELARNERVVAAAAEAAKRAGDELGTRDPGEMLTTAMWRFASSATNKVPWTPEGGGATGPAGSEGSEGSGGGNGARTRRADAALEMFWGEVEDVVESFQRRFIARRFF